MTHVFHTGYAVLTKHLPPWELQGLTRGLLSASEAQALEWPFFMASSLKEAFGTLVFWVRTGKDRVPSPCVLLLGEVGACASFADLLSTAFN